MLFSFLLLIDFNKKKLNIFITEKKSLGKLSQPVNLPNKEYDLNILNEFQVSSTFLG